MREMSHQTRESSLERRRLLKLAREYRQKGYDVILNPTPEDLPSTLAKCPFDLIAAKEEKVIAAEVRSRENLTLNGFSDLRRMTDLIEQVPGWEFELVVTNPRKKLNAS
jgi:Holliday junction resolvase